MKTKYAKTPKTGKLNPKSAAIVAKELARIQREVSVITPKEVVNRAANPRSPLHKFFEWDDNVAAARYREWQARNLICSVYIMDLDGDDSAPIRAFANCSPEEDDDPFIADRGYVSIQSIAGRQNYQAQVLEYARQQLVGWRKRFGQYKEFFGVVQAIDSLK